MTISRRGLLLAPFALAASAIPAKTDDTIWVPASAFEANPRERVTINLRWAAASTHSSVGKGFQPDAVYLVKDKA